MTNKNVYYYVYRITNVIENKHYYGSRKSKIEPKNELGIKYFSSSVDKDFKCDQKNNPDNYKYKVIYTSIHYYKCLNLEIRLHEKFNVSSNTSFYNRQIQRRNGFTTEGKTVAIYANGSKERFQVDVNDPRFESGEIIHFMKGVRKTKEHIEKNRKSRLGKKRSEESKRKQSESSKGHKKPDWFGDIVSRKFKGVEKTKEHRQKLSEANLGNKHSEEAKKKMTKSSRHLIPCKWADGRNEEILAVSKNDPRYKSGELIYMHKKKRNTS